MPERIKLTEKVIRDAEPVPGRDYQIFDTDVRGFAACIYRGGGRAFTLDYRHAGRQRRMTFGRWPEWSVSAARERAKELRREIDAGADPLGQREAPRVADLIERYCAEHLPKLSERSAADQRSALAKMVTPVWGRKLVTEITPTDVDKLLTKIAEGRARPHKEKPNNRAHKLQGAKPTPVRANRMVARLDRIAALRRFGLEVFLNDCWLHAGLRLSVVRWQGVSSPAKSRKQGLLRGAGADLRMLADIFATVPPRVALAQIWRLRRAAARRSPPLRRTAGQCEATRAGADLHLPSAAARRACSITDVRWSCRPITFLPSHSGRAKPCSAETSSTSEITMPCRRPS